MMQSAMFVAVALCAFLKQTQAQPANDQCDNAEALIVNGPTLQGSNVDATSDTNCGSTSFSEQGVWYLVQGTGRTMTIDTCAAATDFTTEIRPVPNSCRASCPANEDPGFSVPCDNPFGATHTFDSDLGTTYNVLVSGATMADIGSFGIKAVDYEPPPNDLCVDALPLIVNGVTQTGSTINATRDTSCGSTNRSERGVWYLVQGTGRIMTIHTCQAATDFVTEIRPVPNSCRASCPADEDPGFAVPCNNPFGVTYTFDSGLGANYNVLVSGSTTSDVGGFEIAALDYEPPPNDLCLDALPLIVNGVTQTGSTVNATRDTSCGSTNRSERGVWYLVQGTGRIMTIHTCEAATDFVTEIRPVPNSCRASCPADDDPGFPVPCNNPFGVTYTFDSVLGTNYNVLVSGSTTSDIGGFGITAFDYEPPPNDLCADAISLVVNGATLTGSTVNATRDTNCGSTNRSERGVWYVVQGTGGVLTISTCNAATDFQTEIRPNPNACRASCPTNLDPGVSEPCSNIFGTSYTFNSDANSRYFVLISGSTTSDVGNFGVFASDPSFVASPTQTPVEVSAAPSAISNAPSSIQTTTPPTTMPSQVPTSAPSSIPSIMPTSGPTPSSTLQTAPPTLEPSLMPSMNQSVSDATTTFTSGSILGVILLVVSMLYW